MDLRQCKNILASGAQCAREALPEGDYCSKCANCRGGCPIQEYDLQSGADRVSELAGKDLSLRSETAIMQMLFERRYNHIMSQGGSEEALQTGPLMDLIQKISNVKEKRDAMERRRGDLLDKARVNELANDLLSAVVSVLADEIEDEARRKEMIKAISLKFLSIVKGDQ